MKLLKVISEKTFKNKQGKDQHCVSYFIVLDNGTRIAFTPNYQLDKNVYSKLESVCEVKNNATR